jgi:L-lactate dehydrogenase complex protein LldE
VKVLLLPTCLPDLLFPGAVQAAERVLVRGGCAVEFRPAAVCCGQPAWNSGHVAEARRVALGTLRALEGPESIVSCSGSCASMIHEYWPELFAGTKWQRAAQDASHRVREFSSFVAGELGVEALGPARLRRRAVIGYHDSCHMMRMLGVSEAPRELLAHIDGLELRALDASTRCCGFGGTFSIRYPELSGAMGDEKVDAAVAGAIDVLVASDLGCLVHICGLAQARGVSLRGRYIAEILDEALREAAGDVASAGNDLRGP